LAKFLANLLREAAFSWLFIRPVLAGQQATGERVEWNHRDTFSLANGSSSRSIWPKQQVIAWLDRGDPCQM